MGRRAHELEFAATAEEHDYYVGALPLMLAVAALVVRPRAARIAVALVGAASILVATGLSRRCSTSWCRCPASRPPTTAASR